MTRKLLFLLALIISCASGAFAQTQACPSPPPPGAESCNSTCVYCDFNGYMGTNNGTPSGGNSGCPSISLHNDQWFGFVAGTDFISIDVLTTVAGCTTPDGLQAAFYDACGEDAIECNGGSDGGAGSPLNLSYGGFVPGQTYYLMIDGYSGCVCDYEISVSAGSITPPPPGAATPPQGPLKVCPGAEVVYTVPPVDAAGYYQWTAPAGASINGGPSSATFAAPEGTEVTITFGSAGGSVCVRVGNACYPSTQACINVVNQPIPPTQLPIKRICYNELPFEWEEEPHTIINNPGTFNLTSTPYDSYLGCDSTVKQTIIARQIVTTNLGVQYICEGQCYTINGNSYCNNTGQTTENFETYDGCDSLVTFSVQKVNANAVILPPVSINCTNPSISLNSTGSTALNGGVTYTWKNSTWGMLGMNNVTQTISTGGIYHLIVTNQSGTAFCRDTATITVTDNTVPPGVTVISDSMNCISTSAFLQGSSGTAGVNYLWSGPGITPANQFLQNPTVNVPGTYTLVVTNPVNSCTSAGTAIVAADNQPPGATLSNATLNCNVASTVLTPVTNGVSGVTYLWSGPGITAANQSLQNQTVNTGGTFSVTVTNPVNGCTSTASATVAKDVEIPTANAGVDQQITCLAPNITLNGAGSATTGPVSYSWTGPGITPANQNVANPTVNTAGTYILTIQNGTNFCSKTDTVTVVSNAVLPDAVAGTDQLLTCADTVVTLNSNGSSQGANYTATWSGPGITPTNQNQYNPQVEVNGVYTIQILNTDNGCTQTDQVTVNINTTAPTANAGNSQQLTCTTTNGVTLSGSGTPANVTYLWTGPGVGANNETQQNPQVTVAGIYTVQTTNPANGCTATATVQVTQDANVPVANAGPDPVINCTVSVVDINASASSTGGNITYQWSGPGINATNINVQSPTGLTLPGTYNLTVTNTSNNCKQTDVVVVVLDNILPTADAGADVVLNCKNGVTDTLIGAASSAGANITYTWSGPGINATNQHDLNPIISAFDGVYTLLVTNTDNTCTSTATVTANLDIAEPAADAGLDQIIDCVTTSTAIGGNSATGANITYSWTGPGITASNKTLASPTVSVPGTYNIVVTNTTNGCTSSNDMVVTSDAVYPTAVAGPDGLITCDNPGETLNGAASSNGTGFSTLWTGPGITPANQAQLSPMVSDSGTYILQITNTTNSCISRDTVYVAANTTNPTASAGPDLALDCLKTNDELDGSLSTTGATIIYLWTGPGITPANEGDQSPNVSMSGTYNLTVLNAENGCSATDAVQVSVNNTLPNSSAGLDQELTCAFADRTLDGAASSTGANYTYVWVGPGINTSNFDDQNPVVAVSGTYTLIVTDITNNCTDTDEVFVGQDKTPPIVAAGANITLTCADPSLPLDGSLSQTGTNITYSWSGPGLVSGVNTATPTVNQIGDYILLVTNIDNGCTSTDAVTVNENKTVPVTNAGLDAVITCANSATGVQLTTTGSDTGPNFTYLWSGPGITPTNQNQQNPTVLSPGTYMLTITNSVNGCIGTDDALVDTDNQLPTSIPGANQVVTCNDPLVTLDGSTSTTPGGGVLTYAWAGPGINAVNQNEPFVQVSAAGTYTLTVQDPLTGCQASANVQVTLDNAPPVIQVTGAQLTCQVSSGHVTVTSSLTGSIYQWEGPDINQANDNLPSPLVDVAGLYLVTVTAPNGCTAMGSTEVMQDASVPVGLVESTPLNCLNNGMATISGTIQSPTGSVGKWTGPGGFTSDQLSATVTTPGIYVLTITAPNGCTKTYSEQVVADYAQPPASIAPADMIDCNTPSVTLNANSSVGPNFSYAWSTNTGSINSGGNSLNPVVDKAGTYTIVVTNALNGCTNEAEVDVQIDPLVPSGFLLDLKNIRCFGETNGAINIGGVDGGTAPFQYTLTDPNGNVTNTYTGLGAGEYLLHLEDANGCEIDSLITIDEPEELIISLGDDFAIQLGESATVELQIARDTSVAIESIIWNSEYACPGCTTFTYDPLESYRHKVTVRDENGCVKTDILDVLVEKPRDIFVANSFDPNSNDPANSILYISAGPGVKRIKTWNIYDRWGNAVFAAKDFLPSAQVYWDGNIGSKKGHAAVYVWYAEVEYIDGETKFFKGDTAILR